jgi:hypothetical protein
MVETWGTQKGRGSFKQKGSPPGLSFRIYSLATQKAGLAVKPEREGENFNEEAGVMVQERGLCPRVGQKKTVDQ